MASRLAGLDPGKYLVTDPDFYRPAEIQVLIGNPPRLRPRWDGAPRPILGVWCMRVHDDCASLGVDSQKARTTKVS